MAASWNQTILQRLLKFRMLSNEYRKCLLTSCVVLAFVKLGLVTIRYNRLRRMIPPATEDAPAALLDKLGWCIPRAARFIWGASCLTQALAMQMILAKKGYRTELCIGARRNPDGVFLAHAWLRSNGRVVLGGSETELSEYAQFQAVSLEPR